MNSQDKNNVLTFFLDLGETINIFWWKFFDWVAVLSWSSLILISFITMMIVGGMLGFGGFAALLVFISILTKSLAGGKRKAELEASSASNRANFEALERRLLEAEMAALQAQIEPHFLFNTLALIGQLIETNPEKAGDVHNHLIKYLRAALPQIRENCNGKLVQQMDLSRAYLLIMQARMQERLTFELLLPKELENAPFPSMMIQTLVENSIKHGLEPKINGGHIQITARMGEQEIQVEVLDNGIGFNSQSGDGLGLTNIRERLKGLYGNKAQLVIVSPLQGGAKLTLHVPLQS
jgi:LytS/YehU family sensor histidine kinase